MRIHLHRFAYTPMGTFGVLLCDGLRVYTVEPPWRDNRQSVSCIPEGIYQMTKHSGFTKPLARWQLNHVPDRFAILIHVGNTMRSTEGCICPGQALGFVNDLWAVVNSRVATERFNLTMEHLHEAEIVIGFDRDAWRAIHEVPRPGKRPV